MRLFRLVSVCVLTAARVCGNRAQWVLAINAARNYSQRFSILDLFHFLYCGAGLVCGTLLLRYMCSYMMAQIHMSGVSDIWRSVMWFCVFSQNVLADVRCGEGCFPTAHSCETGGAGGGMAHSLTSPRAASTASRWCGEMRAPRCYPTCMYGCQCSMCGKGLRDSAVETRGEM